MADRTPPLSVEELHALVASGEIDTVVLAFPDMQGRLQGKRFAARFFLDEVLHHGTEGCNYLLAVDTEMNTVDGYAMSSWERGYGDFAMHPDLSTLRRIPWHPGTALLIADLAWGDGSPVVAAPRQILRRQLARLAELGYTAQVGTELEFIVFKDTYEQAWDANYRGLTPANQYNIDYSVLGTGRIEPLLRRLRNDMAGAGLTVESAKGECNPGQHEIAFRYDEALRTCDQHALYKTGAKEIAAQEGCSITFMAKYNEREGNSCHIHLSLADADGNNAMAGSPDDPGGMSDVMRHFLAGQLAALRDFSLLYAPNINSYKRFQPGSFAPTAVAWGPRQPHLCAARRRPRPLPALREPPPRRGRQPPPGRRRSRRGRPVRHRRAAGTARALPGQRLHRRLRTRPHHPAGGRRAVGEQPDRQGRLRFRGGRPLPQHGARRAGCLRRRGHRLGAAPLLRTPVKGRPVTDPHQLLVRNPATEETVALVPAAGPQDVDAAVARAARVQPAWAALAPADRARLLRRFADTVDAHLEELARLEVREAGHTVGNARWEAGNARDLLLYAAGGAERLLGKQIPVPGGWNVTSRNPWA